MSSGENITNNHQGVVDNVNNQSTTNSTGYNGGSNVVTCDSASSPYLEDGQTPGTCKLFSYSKQILTAEQYLFWIDHRGRVSGEVVFIFENTEICMGRLSTFLVLVLVSTILF